jgi:hypothetical protein
MDVNVVLNDKYEKNLQFSPFIIGLCKYLDWQNNHYKNGRLYCRPSSSVFNVKEELL